jgi:hypothetical protein
MEFSEKDAADLAKLKQVMFDKAADGDAQAAVAFASLLNAETNRQELRLKNVDKTKMQEATDPTQPTWTENPLWAKKVRTPEEKAMLAELAPS